MLRQEFKAICRIKPELRNLPLEWVGFVVQIQDHLTDLHIAQIGSAQEVTIDPILLFQMIFSFRPNGIYLFHNHPSGNLYASREDIVITRQIQQVLVSVNIAFYGHWVITPQGERKIVFSI